MTMSFVLMTLEFKSTSRPLMHNEPFSRRLQVSTELELRRMFASDATKYTTPEQRVTAKAVVTVDASRKLAA